MTQLIAAYSVTDKIMRFDLDTANDRCRYELYTAQLLEERGQVEVTRKHRKRTLSQNAYYHVCISLYAIEFGLTIYEAKTDLKRACPFMVYEKHGNKYLRPSRDLDKKEMMDYIEWIRTYAGQHGCYIPTAEEYLEGQIEIDRQINAAKHYL